MKAIFNDTLHKKWSFSWRISSENVTKSAGNWEYQASLQYSKIMEKRHEYTWLNLTSVFHVSQVCSSKSKRFYKYRQEFFYFWNSLVAMILKNVLPEKDTIKAFKIVLVKVVENCKWNNTLHAIERIFCAYVKDWIFSRFDWENLKGKFWVKPYSLS